MPFIGKNGIQENIEKKVFVSSKDLKIKYSDGSTEKKKLGYILYIFDPNNKKETHKFQLYSCANSISRCQTKKYQKLFSLNGSNYTDILSQSKITDLGFDEYDNSIEYRYIDHGNIVTYSKNNNIDFLLQSKNKNISDRKTIHMNSILLDN